MGKEDWVEIVKAIIDKNNYSDKTYAVMTNLKEQFNNKDTVLSSYGLKSSNILKYSPFMFTKKEYPTKEDIERRHQLIDYAVNFNPNILEGTGLESIPEKERFLAIGGGCIDKHGLMVIGMAPGFWRIHEFNELSYPFKPSFFYANTSRILRDGFRDFLKYIYFTNLSKFAYSKDVLTPDVYKKLYEKCFPILKKEIDLLEPKKIITLGNDVHNFLTEKGINCEKVFHPSYFIMKGQDVEGVKHYKEFSRSMIKTKKKQKHILLIFGCNHLGSFSKYRLSVELKYINMDKDNKYYFFSFADPKKVKKYLCMDNVELIDGRKYMGASTWSEAYSCLDSIYKEYGIDKIHMIFSPLIINNSLGKESNIVDNYNKTLTDDSFFSSFFSIKNYYRRLCVSLYLMNKYKIPLIHFIDDTLEPDYKKIGFSDVSTFHYYKFPAAEAEFFPFVEYAFIHSKDELPKVEKEYDFIFGMTSVMTSCPYRHNIIGKFLNMEKDFKENNMRYQYFFKDKKRKIKSYVDGRVYNDKYILGSKFTFVVPSYNLKGFSYIRFIEAVDRWYIPLICKDCEWELAFFDRPHFLNIILKNNLVVSEDDIIDKIKSTDYNEVIKELRECDDYKNTRSDSFYKEYYEKYKEIIF